MAVDLLLRNQSGQIELSGDDWDQIDQMLHESSDTAAGQLWPEYFDASFLTRIAGYGMPGAAFTQDPPYWGYMYCTADDLDGAYSGTRRSRSGATPGSRRSGPGRSTRRRRTDGEQRRFGGPGRRRGWRSPYGGRCFCLLRVCVQRTRLWSH